MKTTLSDRREPAFICRERGWEKGTRLVGDEGCGPTVIEITAVGEEKILAKTISHNGDDTNRNYWTEHSWVLWCRDWHVVPNVKLRG